MSLRIALACLAVTVVSSLTGATFSAFTHATHSAGNSFAAATSFSCVSKTLPASQDTYVKYSDNQALTNTQNFGTAAMTRIWSNNQDGDYGDARVLIKFDLTSLSGCTITSAKLRLRSHSYADPNLGTLASASGRIIDLHRVNASWVENGTGGVTWSSQPAHDANTANRVSISSLGSDQWYEWTVTSHAQSMAAGGNHGWLIKDRDENASNGQVGENKFFRTREHPTTTVRPELVVTVG